jgi:hypothetical protein
MSINADIVKQGIIDPNQVAGFNFLRRPAADGRVAFIRADVFLLHKNK